MMRLMVRGYLGRTMQFERRLNVDEADHDQVMRRLAEQHVAEMEMGTLGMIEIEFLDEPDVNQRFHRVGIDPRGMVMPILMTGAPPVTKSLAGFFRPNRGKP